ncbi:MAG: hypothetical protein IIA67_01925 [Planctomycetes bacterium]|nr:hypothetical protein [Planctomycetota bacterium]
MASAIRYGDGFEYRNEAQFLSWIFTIAKRAIHRTTTKSDRVPRATRIKGELSSGVGVPEDTIRSPMETPSGIASRGERHARLRERIANLPDRMAQAAKIAKEECNPISDIRGSASYRQALVEVLVRRNLDQAVERDLVPALHHAGATAIISYPLNKVIH